MMITHIGGLDAASSAIMEKHNLGKKIIYSHIDMPLTAISDFKRLGNKNKLFKNLNEICEKYNNKWNEEAEAYLLKYFGVDY